MAGLTQADVAGRRVLTKRTRLAGMVALRQGSDCLDQFRAMQSCFNAHPEYYKPIDDDAPPAEDTAAAAQPGTTLGRREAPLGTRCRSPQAPQALLLLLLLGGGVLLRVAFKRRKRPV